MKGDKVGLYSSAFQGLFIYFRYQHHHLSQDAEKIQSVFIKIFMKQTLIADFALSIQTVAKRCYLALSPGLSQIKRIMYHNDTVTVQQIINTK